MTYKNSAHRDLAIKTRAISVLDTSRIGTCLAYTGCGADKSEPIPNIQQTESGMVTTCDFNSIYVDPETRFHEMPFRIALTSLSPLSAPIHTSKELESVLTHIREVACSELPSISRAPGGHDFLGFYAFLDIPGHEEYQEQLTQFFTSLQDDIIDSLSLRTFNSRGVQPQSPFQFGLIAQEKISDEYFSSQVFRNYVDSVLSQYTRYIFVQDDTGNIHINPVNMVGLVSSPPGQGSKNLATLHIDSSMPSKDVLSELTELVNSKTIHENKLQDYFEKHPELLSVFGEEAVAYPQIALVNNDGRFFRPDFLIEPIKTGRTIHGDLKLPSQKIVLRQRNRDRFYARLHEYIAQLREYGRYFDSYSNRRWFRMHYGFEPFEPRPILIVGKDYGTVDSQVLTRLMEHAYHVEIMTYLDLLKLHGKV